MPPTEPIAWTESQRRVLIILTAAVVVYSAFRLLRDRSTIADPPPALGERFNELKNRIDPNTADAATLAALPGLGEKRAREFVAYREEIQRRQPGVTAFARPEDLMRIDGVGPALMMQLTPYMIFPATQPATLPTN